MNIFPLDKHSYIFPNPLDATCEGPLAYGGDLNPNRIIKAYMNGIFPWYNQDDPILWWSPNPRCIMHLEDFKVSKSLQKTIDQQKFDIKFNKNFRQVITECSKIPRDNQKGSWIHSDVIEAYVLLHEQGFAHSFEAYFDGKLVGGGYGVVIGDIFCGESMFAKESDASKVAYYHLVQRLKVNHFSLVDCQIPTPHLLSLGAKIMSREDFLKRVKNALNNPRDF